MFGTPITYCPEVAVGSAGKVVSVKMNDMFAESIKSLQLIDTLLGTSLPIDSADLSDLLAMTNSDSPPSGAYSLSGGILYIFFDTSIYDYVDSTLFFLVGTRTGLPLTDFNSIVDVPEKDLELFIKYAIRESAELQGKIVPPAIEQDIRELESKYEVS